jgi:hypothetical protein
LNTTVAFERVRVAKDERFNIEYLSQYELLLFLNGNDFFVSVVDTLDHRCLYFEQFELLDDTHTEVLEELFDSHQFLKAAFWKKIKFSKYNNNFTLIPNGLFIAENAFDYLDLVSEVRIGSDKVLTYQHDNTGMTCVFSVDYPIYNWITNFYQAKKIQFIHPASSEIEMLLTAKTQETREVIDLNFSQTAFSVSYKKANKLEFANIFAYQTTDDVLYFVFAVFEALKVNVEQVTCNFYGTIEMQSSVFAELKKIVKQAKFGIKPKQVQFAHSFDDLQQYRYNDLFAMYLC